MGAYGLPGHLCFRSREIFGERPRKLPRFGFRPPEKSLRHGGSDNMAEAVAKLCVELEHVTKETAGRLGPQDELHNLLCRNPSFHETSNKRNRGRDRIFEKDS